MASPKQKLEIKCCPVCYDSFEEHDEDVDIDVEAGQGGGKGRIELECRHVFCRNCLLEYCRHNIAIQRIPIPCPTVGNNKDAENDDGDTNHLNYCEQVLQNGLVENILQDDEKGNDNSQHLIKFRRFQQMAQDPTLIPCPKCDELVSRLLPRQQGKGQSRQPVSSSSSEDKDIVKGNNCIKNKKDNKNGKHETVEDAPLSCHSFDNPFLVVYFYAHPVSHILYDILIR